MDSRTIASTDMSQLLNELRIDLNTFLDSVIDAWSSDCQHKSNAELARSMKRIEWLRAEFGRISKDYALADEHNTIDFD